MKVKTKIICTIGPSSENTTVLRKMICEGMDIARLNFSHGTHAEHKKRIDIIRKLNKKYRRNILILQDLEGYRIRIGKFKNNKSFELKKGTSILLTNNKNLTSYENMIFFDYTGDIRDIKEGTHIFIDDGTIELFVKINNGKFIKTKVITPGILKENKGINIPGLKLKFKGLTKKDKIDLEFGIKNKVDFIAQSFVRNKEDIFDLRKIISLKLPSCKIIAKIENQDGIKNIDEIIDASDGIMIARGDMGISVPIYKIPVIQKEIIKKCNIKKKFVITATQMLESMIDKPIPTRAEVTDVSNAVFDGTDMVMLSAETAIGKYPVKAVRVMNQILKFTENYIKKQNKIDNYSITGLNSISE